MKLVVERVESGREWGVDASMNLRMHTPQEKTPMKLVVDGATDKVLGVHMVGSEAGEIIQLAGVCLKVRHTRTLHTARARARARAATVRRSSSSCACVPAAGGGDQGALRRHHRRPPHRRRGVRHHAHPRPGPLSPPAGPGLESWIAPGVRLACAWFAPGLHMGSRLVCAWGAARRGRLAVGGGGGGAE
jgi:hypothetical protein